MKVYRYRLQIDPVYAHHEQVIEMPLSSEVLSVAPARNSHDRSTYGIEVRDAMG